MENLVTVTIRSTHYHLIESAQGWWMVDTGWAGTLPALQGQLRRSGISLEQIRFLMFTHHHPDHAGLTQELKQASGARLVIHEVQLPYLKDLAEFYQGKQDAFLPVQVGADDIVVNDENRGRLQSLGLQGEILTTPGHSSDSVSLVLDSGMAFTGDLPPPGVTLEENSSMTIASWRKLLQHSVHTVYPAHSRPFSSDVIRSLLQQVENGDAEDSP